MKFIKKFKSLFFSKNSIFAGVLFSFVITVLFFYKMLTGYLPIPTDALIGGYFPWLDYKWGYVVGIPYKNVSLSDVFSQLYPWRELGMDLIRQGSWPLWNPYSFSGTPLLANWQSAPFYPLNILMHIFGNHLGWGLLITIQIFLSLLFMYLFLMGKKMGKTASIAGATVFAFSGFMTNYLEYATIGQAFIWVSLILLLIDKSLISNKLAYLLPIPFLIFSIITAGSFQAAFYALIIIIIYSFQAIYFLTKNIKSSFRKILIINIFLVLGILMSAVQLVPTFELLSLSIRDLDQNIVQYKYGLLPVQNLFTFISPDFFGNPSTGNFWGFMGYQETAGYFGISALVFVILSIYIFIKTKRLELLPFIVLFFVTLILVVDSPLSRLIYTLKIPLFSTSYATRMMLFITFSAGVLTSFGIANYSKHVKATFRITLILWLFTITMLVGLESYILYLQKNSETVILIRDLKVAFKNTLLPFGIITLFLLAQKLIKNQKALVAIFALLIIADLFRFSYKQSAFSKKELMYPQTPAISFVKDNVGFNRFERERTEVFPSNTWIPYKLMSPSGYDPLYSLQYARFYNVYNLNSPEGGITRYLELSNYDSPLIDLVGVKYLMVAKRDKSGVIDKEADTISYQLQNPKYKKVFEDKTTVILENTQVLPRVMLFANYKIEPDTNKTLKAMLEVKDFKKTLTINREPEIKVGGTSKDDYAAIREYQANNVRIDTKTKENQILFLSDTFYPGWKAYIDGKETEIFLANGNFRALALPAGEHTVWFNYFPNSFRNGLIVSAVSVMMTTGLGIITWKRRFNI